MVTSKLGKVSAIIAFVLCLLAGLLLLWVTRFSIIKDQVLYTAMGIYFVGKAFFVGPALLLLDKGSKE